MQILDSDAIHKRGFRIPSKGETVPLSASRREAPRALCYHEGRRKEPFMADIQLRFHRDVLVLSSPVAPVLARQGFDVDRDLEYANVVDPEAVRDALNLNLVAGAQCLVAATAGITPARLAHHGMEGRAPELAQAALATAAGLSPQHVLVEVGPCGLPLDPQSKNSLNENRDQYARAARAFEGLSFDAFLLNGFSNPTDLKCALMGIRQVSGVPAFASVDVDASGTLADGRHSLEEALDVMVEFEASVAGIQTSASLPEACALVKRLATTVLPVLVQLSVGKNDPKQGEPTPENPYYCPDVLVQAAAQLRRSGAQFLRATGAATPAFTGALVAATAGLDVVRPDIEG